MTSKEVSKKLGVSEATLCNYEKKGYLKPHRAVPSGRKDYDEADVDRLYHKMYKE